MNYRVHWTIDVDAESPEEAARQALTIHRNPGSWATHFTVRGEGGATHEVDLGYPAGPSRSNAVQVLVPMEEGIVRGVQVLQSREIAEAAERQWLAERGLENPKDREHASDWGTGIAIWDCELEA